MCFASSFLRRVAVCAKVSVCLCVCVCVCVSVRVSLSLSVGVVPLLGILQTETRICSTVPFGDFVASGSTLGS